MSATLADWPWLATGPRFARLVSSLAATAAVGCALAAFGCVLGEHGRFRPAPGVVGWTDTAFVSGGHRVAVERIATALPGRHPLILVLHPSDGTEGGGIDYVRRYADLLARAGYVAYVVHYFDRTGDRATDDAREDAAYPEWVAALGDAIDFGARDPAADARRVGAFGVSLGAWVALALGAADARLGAVVGEGSGLFDALAPTVRHLPPTLLLHGAGDDVVAPARAWAADSVLSALGVAHELIVYPGQGHGLGGAAAEDARERTVRFFDLELKGEKR